MFSEEELTRSRHSTREVTQLARHWEEDYRSLSREYEEALKARSQFEDRVRLEEAELAHHKEIYEQLVRKYDHFEGMYKELEIQVRHLESQKMGFSHYDKESADLVTIENSTLKQEILQLNYQITELSRHQSAEP